MAVLHILWKLIAKLLFPLSFEKPFKFPTTFQRTVILRLLIVFLMLMFLDRKGWVGFYQPICSLGKWVVADSQLSAVSPYSPVLNCCWKLLSCLHISALSVGARTAKCDQVLLVLSVMVLKTAFSTPSQGVFITRKRTVVLCWQQSFGLLSVYRWPWIFTFRGRLLGLFVGLTYSSLLF